ncbi:uncharacterized protein PRCAT00003850001 [Priceomyces carsonii]|uniref:uncharacterized protein n=1 Tax=Priceomyces carsonii TaxID=28549 RepID=UPI002ED807D6|nr:unnamed protein product [Priceomyces carsonii]
MDQVQQESVEFPARQRLLQQQQLQQETRARMRQQKLKSTFLGYLAVLIFFSAVQFIGIAFFTLGFLLSRQVLPNISDCSGQEIDPCMKPAKFDKAIVLVIDALRFDFAIPVDGSSEYYHNNFPILYDLAQQDNGVLLKFISDPPTTTLQRLKGMTTGSLPTFIDAGSNFNGDAIDEDNWVSQLQKNDKSIAFMGDDTWSALFSHNFNPNLSFPYPSLNVWDLHTVDNGVIEHLYPLMQKENSSKWDVLIGHFLGVDHVGHRFGPNHFSMKDKLEQMNKVIKEVVSNMNDNTLLIVMGDHGMDSTGNHGGDSLDELESTLFMYSKKNVFDKKNAATYDITNLGKNYRSVHQIDLVPTISLLLGLPVPYNNLGFPIDEAFANERDLSSAVYKTLFQIRRLRLATPNLSFEITERFSYLINAYSKLGRGKYHSFIEEAKKYQSAALEECKMLWATFDLKTITIGIILLFMSFTFIMTYSRSIPSVRVLTMSFEFIGSVIAMSLLGLVSSLSIYVVLSPRGFDLKQCLSIGLSLGIITGFWAPIMDRFSVNWLWHQVADFFTYNFNFWSFLGLLFITLHSLIFASNSYVIWEDKMVLFFLLAFGGCCLFRCATNRNMLTPEKILAALHSITFIIFTRLVSMINLCREEQQMFCTSTFKTNWWTIALLHCCSYALPLTIKSFYKLTDSYHSAAPIWIGTGLKFMMTMNAFYWTFEYIENVEFLKHQNSFISGPLLKSLKLAIARIVMFFCLVLANFSWSRGPLCVKLALTESDGDAFTGDQPRRTATILGYENVYGSSYFLLVLNFTVAVMLVMKPIGAISICMLLIQILSLLELYYILDLRRNLIAPILFGLLGYQHFFSTGHQATIPSIQWEIGFMTTESIFFPFTHLNILLNTFGSFVIICLSIPLITLWRLPPSNKPITVLSQIITDITTLMTYQTLTSLSSLIFAAYFRRHLMVWKIFAPRFMLSGLLLIVTNITLIIFTLWFGTGKILTQVNRIFGK